MRHVPPSEWVKDAPPLVLSDMLAAGLAQGAFNAKIALNFLTPEVAAENCSPHLLWSCIAEAVAKAFHLGDAGTQASATLQKASATLDKKEKADKERADKERADKERNKASKAKIEAVVVKGAEIVKPMAEDAESWENVVMPVGDDEVVEETSPGSPTPQPPEPPRAAARR